MGEFSKLKSGADGFEFAVYRAAPKAARKGGVRLLIGQDKAQTAGCRKGVSWRAREELAEIGIVSLDFPGLCVPGLPNLKKPTFVLSL